MASQEEIDAVLDRVDATLQTAKHGLEDLKSRDRSRRNTGLRNLIVFGRSVTFVLQNLRGKADGFDEWYVPERDRMSSNPLMRYFVQARNNLEKQGKVNLGRSMFIQSFSSDDIDKFPRPPRARSFFLGDELGGAGWEVETEDGTIEKYYVRVPESMLRIDQHFTDVAQEKAPELEGRTVDDLCDEYIGELSSLVRRARERFGKPPTASRPSVPYLRRVK